MATIDAARVPEPAPSAHAPDSVIWAVLLTGLLLAYSAQQLLMPVLAPLARELALTETQLGLIISVAAIVLVIASPLWGRACTAWGARLTLLAGLSLATVGLAGFAVIGHLALAGQFTPQTRFWLAFATRGVLFGTGLAAAPVAAMATVAALTSGEEERTAGFARIGAVQGLSVALGPALGTLLAFGGLLGPLWAAPAAIALATLSLALFLPRDLEGASAHATPSEPTAPVDPAGRSRRSPVLATAGQPGVWPYLLAGFLLYTSLGLVLVTVGFFLQDQLALEADATARAGGLVLTICGLVLVAVQGLAVPKLRWAPDRLLRTGPPLAALGLAIVVSVPHLAAIACGMGLFATGLGIAMPGYTAGPTLAVDRAQHAAVAGVLGATNGLAFVAGPIVGTALYGLAPSAPFLAGALASLAAWALVLAHPAFRRRTAINGDDRVGYSPHDRPH